MANGSMRRRKAGSWPGVSSCMSRRSRSRSSRPAAGRPTSRPEEKAMTKIFGLSGSLRAGSYNTALLRAAAKVAPAGTEVTVGTIRGVPLYDGDVEAAEGIPATVAALKDAVAAADGLLLVTPEYNNGIPGVFKNAI